MAVAYSSTKIWAGLTAAILAGRGLLNYTEKARPQRIYPKRPKNQQQDFRFQLSGRNTLKMEKKAQPSEIFWTTGRGYHALTYGFLVDQMIRRLHPRHYTVSQFYQKEDSVPYNEPAVRELPLVSCMGIGTAAGFAEALHQVISNAEKNETLVYMIQKKMIPDSLCKNISEPTATEEDIVLNKKVSFGHGFLYAPHPVRKGEWIIRILGNGLQAVEMDFKEDVIIVMLRNGLRAGEDGEDDYEAISEAVHHTVHDIRRNSDRLL
ncbi:unnamed protein product [Heligmosomoides polygyrus]|uniref:Beta-lactamase domain-containing protein n=1 Tax=Heligmosomoides polygyrus TaxID=6339 RepID=A0A3P7ZJ32_HELPZ|nr:unnamed protein product [Heligmosomoides polygyrus]